jgi:hypothetical protein
LFLTGWPDHIRETCDDDNRWRDCARHKLALQGGPVPISLLPNGKQAHHLDRLGSTTLHDAPPSRPPEPYSRTPRNWDGPPPRKQRQPSRRWWSRIADWLRGPRGRVHRRASPIAVVFALIRIRRTRSRIHAGVIPGAVLFGTGWAISGGCPAIPIVQVATGYLPALVTIAGVVVGMRLCRWANAKYFHLDRGPYGL